MGMSKKWVALSPEEKAIKRKEYRERYKIKHPERIAEQDKRYKENHRDELREKASDWQKEKGRLNKLKAIEYLGGKCLDCGNEYPQYVYEFHHLEPTNKEFGIAKIMGRSWENIVPELNKCVLLCANCHKIRHNSENFNN